MSIALLTLAFKAPLSSTEKFVLVALCDSANDQGECYPSVKTLAEKCSLGERTVQGALATLEGLGYVRREFRNGRSTTYWIDANPRSSRTPAAAAPPQYMHPTPAVHAPPPPQQPHPTPAAAAPITVNEPSIEPKTKRKSASAPVCVSVAVLVEAGFEEVAADEFIAHKASMKAPLTARAWADHLAESRKAGWTPAAAADKVMAKSWKGFEARYVASESQPGAGGSHQRGPPDRKATQLQVAALMTGTSRTQQPREIIDVTPRVLIA